MKIPFEIDDNQLSKVIGDHITSQCYRQINTIVAEKTTQESIKGLAQQAVAEFLKNYNPTQLHERLHQLVSEEVTRRTKAILKNL